MTFAALLEAKRRSAADAIDLVANGDTVIVPTGVGEPPEVLAALASRRRELQAVKLLQLLPLRHFAYFDPTTTEHVRHVSMFFSDTTRVGGRDGWIDYLPCAFAEIPQFFDRGLIASDVLVSLASPMDAHGYFAISLATDYSLAASRKARAIILEVNPNVPFACGNCRIHVSQVAAVVDSSEPILEVPEPEIGPVEHTIGHYVAELVPDGATLQIGYGGIPSAAIQELTAKHDLGIHTEMVGDGILRLIEAGAVTNRRKNYLPGKMVASFALGSRRLYKFLDRNPFFEIHPVDFTNDPCLAGRNDLLIAINGSMQVDLIGQCGSETHAALPYSGTGGQSDFVRAANRSAGGKAIIVLPSTARDGSISRIVPTLAPGTHVTTGKNDVNYVVTEYGIAQLRGKTARQRAGELIAIAHPAHRNELKMAARSLNLW